MEGHFQNGPKMLKSSSEVGLGGSNGQAAGVDLVGQWSTGQRIQGESLAAV
jgi:hypothetical protein